MAWQTDPDALHMHIPDELGDLTQKATPVDADRILLEDSADGFAKKYAEVGDLPGGGGGGGNAAYAETIGDNTNTTYTVTHNLGTTDLVVQLWDLTGADPVEATSDASSIDAVSANAIEVTFAAAPPVDSYRVVILSDGGGGSGGDTFATQLLHVRDEKTQNTAGGTFSSGAWQTRVLNTVKTNEISGASLATDQITLPAGDYWVEWEAPAFRVNRNQSKLHDTTATADLVIGAVAYSTASANDGSVLSVGRGRFTLAEESVVEVQHRCQTSATTFGFGIEANFTTEVYTDIRIWKLP